MKQKNLEIIRGKKGITLVALVITIIVLLILARSNDKSNIRRKTEYLGQLK